MSRIGKQPVAVPSGVDVSISGNSITVKGPHGELTHAAHPRMKVVFDADGRKVEVKRPDDQRENRALHGLTRALINNMVAGVQKPFVKRLEVVGVGYQASLSGNVLSLQVGYANTVKLPIPPRVLCDVPAPTTIEIKSIDKQAVGQFAAEIRNVRPPEPYKGKGIRYQGEYVRRKAGKAFGSGG
ncbi:MAG: 50S ribosomal protein L6 [Planctomycetaceae bacterium]|nr:50S ribosomal protein L6 [Planctomycetaceae bacterium]